MVSAHDHRERMAWTETSTIRAAVRAKIVAGRLVRPGFIPPEATSRSKRSGAAPLITSAFAIQGGCIGKSAKIGLTMKCSPIQHRKNDPMRWGLFHVTRRPTSQGTTNQEPWTALTAHEKSVGDSG